VLLGLGQSAPDPGLERDRRRCGRIPLHSDAVLAQADVVHGRVEGGAAVVGADREVVADADRDVGGGRTRQQKRRQGARE
jgi:hypothetical protein